MERSVHKEGYDDTSDGEDNANKYGCEKCPSLDVLNLLLPLVLIIRVDLFKRSSHAVFIISRASQVAAGSGMRFTRTVLSDVRRCSVVNVKVHVIQCGPHHAFQTGFYFSIVPKIIKRPRRPSMP